MTDNNWRDPTYSTAASKVINLWRYKNVFIIIFFCPRYFIPKGLGN